jgi:hypothetical protein
LPGPELHHDHDPEFGEIGIAEPVRRREPKRAQELVHNTLVGIEQGPKDERNGEQRQHGWQVEDDAIDWDLRKILVHGQGQHHGDHDTDGNGKSSEVERVPEYLPEKGLIEHVLVVGEPDPLCFAEAGIIRKAQIDGVSNGI